MGYYKNQRVCTEALAASLARYMDSIKCVGSEMDPGVKALKRIIRAPHKPVTVQDMNEAYRSTL